MCSNILRSFTNHSLVETDLSFSDPWPPYMYFEGEIKRIIEFRMSKMSKPFLVEGVCSLRLLKKLGHTPDFAVLIEHSRSRSVESQPDASVPTIVVELNH